MSDDDMLGFDDWWRRIEPTIGIEPPRETWDSAIDRAINSDAELRSDDLVPMDDDADESHSDRDAFDMSDHHTESVQTPDGDHDDVVDTDFEETAPTD